MEDVTKLKLVCAAIATTAVLSTAVTAANRARNDRDDAHCPINDAWAD